MKRDGESGGFRERGWGEGEYVGEQGWWLKRMLVVCAAENNLNCTVCRLAGFVVKFCSI